MNDLRSAVRSLRATPLVTGVAALSLALGIGASVVIFSLTNSLLLRELAVRDPSALVLVTDATVPGVRAYAVGVWDSFRRFVDVFDGTLAWSSTDFNLVPRGEAQIVSGAWVSGSYFETLGISPRLGRMLVESDDRRNGAVDGPVAVISHAFWQRQYGAAPDVIGRSLMLDGVSFTVVGVTPQRFSGLDVGRRADVIVPFGAAMLMPGRENLQVTIMARRRADQTIEGATVALRRLQPQIREASLPQGSRWRQQDLDAYLRDGFVLLPGATGNSRLRLRYERPLGLLMAVVALVLLIASANITNLLLARATDRRRELQVRAALGATRWRLIRGLLAESLVIASVGAALGVALASSGSSLVVRQFSTRINPIYLDVSIDSTVAFFAIAVTGLVTLLAGIVPAIRSTQLVHSTLLRTTGPNEGGRFFGPSAALIVLQVALSVVLVVGAGLFLRTFSSLMTVPLGFEPERVLMAGVNAADARVPPSQRLLMFQRVRDAVRSVPGVADAAFSFLTPVSGPILLRPIESRSMSERERMSSVNLVSPGWFRTLETPIVAGREFVDADRAGTTPVVVVNEAFVRKFLNSSNPLGQVVRMGIVGPNAGSAEVVGVAGDAVYSSLRESAPPTVYFPLAQLQSVPPPSLTLTVRSETASPLQMARSITAAIGTVDPDAAIAFRPLTEQINASLAQERILALLSGFFGGFAVLLAGLGLFGITAYSVSRRRREIGIRMALGADPGSVIRLVLGRVCLIIAAGVVIGAAASMWTTQFTASLLFGLEPRDPVTLALAVVILSGAGLLAALPPAWHASHVDPSVALRSE
ncbi:MAG TPA: ABC transporter permease [Steroidobacteraceae bacterium]